MRMSARKVWVNLHLGLALLAGAVVALLGLSGSLLVLKEPLLEWELGRAVIRPDVRGTVFASVDLWLAEVRRELPTLVPTGINAPRSGFLPTDAAVVFGRLAPSGGLGVALVEPYSGKLLGHFDYDRSWFAAAVEFHRRLLLPMAVGAEIVAWCGVAMLLSLASGLYLWWPRRGGWPNAFLLRHGSRGLRRLRELHNVSAIYLLPPLAVLAVTGILLSKPGWLRAFDSAGYSRPGLRAGPGTGREEPPCVGQLTPQGAIEAALRQVIDGGFVGLTMPRGPLHAGGAYVVRLRPTEAVGDETVIQLMVSGGCPEPTVARLAPQEAIGRDVLSLLHGRLMLGRVGQAAVFLAGLSLPVLYVTGLALWLGRQRHRRGLRASPR